MKRGSSTRLARQATELAVAVPQVVAHRFTRLMLAGPLPNACDRREFFGMGQEKVQAFWQSWFAMGWALLRDISARLDRSASGCAGAHD